MSTTESDVESDNNPGDDDGDIDRFQQPRLLRGHPRWAPTNDPNDINCFHFLIPLPKRSYAKRQHEWLTQTNDLNEMENKRRLRLEMVYYGSLMDCVRLKYLAKSPEHTMKQLMERYGPNEPFNTQLYESNHVFPKRRFRARPPAYFDNPNTPNWRYRQLKYESNNTLANMEFEWVYKQKKKWRAHYKYCWIRGKIKQFILQRMHQKKQKTIDSNSCDVNSETIIAST